MSLRRRQVGSLLAAFAFVLISGCGSSAGSDSSSDSTGTDSSEAPSGKEADWLTQDITDVNGETFTIASLEGQPVFVENFATWCSNCLKQLGKTQEAADAAGDDAVFLALSVETDLNASDVADYAAENGFDAIRFAIMTPEMLAAMNDAFGKTALNPPSTPKIVVAADGTAGEMVTGFEEPDQIAETLAAAGA